MGNCLTESAKIVWILLLLVQDVLGGYDIIIVTSSMHVPYSRGDLHIRMFGRIGSSPWLTLPTKNGFGSRSEHGFFINDNVLKDLGILYKIHIKDSGDSNGWNLDKVVIRDYNRPGVTFYQFLCGCWLRGPEQYHELFCPVDGGWGRWSEWGNCSHSCGGGIQGKTRSCTNPKPSHGGHECMGEPMMTQSCNTNLCPIHGGWIDWTPWGQCDKECGGGVQQRNRSCSNPPPMEGGDDCTGSDVETRVCSTMPCPTHGVWTDWTDWGPCSATCGEGAQTSTRECSTEQCVGESVRMQSCHHDPCPPTALWASWNPWSPCTTTCGIGTRVRVRECKDPETDKSSLDCPGGEHAASEDCLLPDCPDDVVWSDWSHWTRCSLSCDGGTQTSTRTCHLRGSEQEHTGCEGDGTRSRTCNTQSCPPKTPLPPTGEWSEWSSWSTCPVTCGEGTQFRNRTCSGGTCVGSPSEMRGCRIPPCVAIGGGQWGEWNGWSECTKPCGGGLETSYRRCHSIGIFGCSGIPVRHRVCNIHKCEVIPEGNWTNWTEWSECTVSCGGGTRLRHRVCQSEVCVGEKVEQRLCKTFPCPVLDGGWSSWSFWMGCTRSCGGGAEVRSRKCSEPPPTNGGLPCHGAVRQSRQCNTFACPEEETTTETAVTTESPEGVWSPWTEWSGCSASCGDGSQSKVRACYQPGDEPCKGSARVTRKCRVKQCVSAATSGERQQQTGVSDGAIIGIAIGIPALVIINVIVIIYILCKRREGKMKTSSSTIVLPDSPAAFTAATYINEVYEHYPPDVAHDQSNGRGAVGNHTANYDVPNGVADAKEPGKKRQEAKERQEHEYDEPKGISDGDEHEGNKRSDNDYDEI